MGRLAADAVPRKSGVAVVLRVRAEDSVADGACGVSQQPPVLLTLGEHSQVSSGPPGDGETGRRPPAFELVSLRDGVECVAQHGAGYVNEGSVI